MTQPNLNIHTNLLTISITEFRPKKKISHCKFILDLFSKKRLKKDRH